MLKKRLIFTLLYADGFFMQSRNFNIQKVGDINWLKKNYNLKNISNYIDELIVLDISRNEKDLNNFIYNLKKISNDFFIPITAGGGINTFNYASKLLRNGADKVLVNSILNTNSKVVYEIADTYGSQSIIGGIDYKFYNNKISCFTHNGTVLINKIFSTYLKKIYKFPIGEIYINSIDQDGTGMGLDTNIINKIPKKFFKPVIISGGCGNYTHIKEGLENKGINAVSTANLFNFVNNGLETVRMKLLKDNFRLPEWNSKSIKHLKGIFNKKIC